MSSAFEAIVWKDNKIVLLDQTQIPISETYISYDELTPYIDAIQRLVVRGAPALGVAGAYGVVLVIDEAARKGHTASELEHNLDLLRDARPTAVNLAWAVEKIRKH
jgi:methylthioribose-1-phosphate isomerase